MNRWLKYGCIMVVIIAGYIILAACLHESSTTFQKYKMKAEFSEWENAGKPRGFDLANYAAKRKKQVPFIREFGELSNGMGDKHIFIIMDFGVRIVGIEGMGMFTEK